jgi:hypothetical protein
MEIGLARGGPENPRITRLTATDSPSVNMWLSINPIRTFGPRG